MTERRDYYILRDWLSTKILRVLSPTGVWMAPDPAPLTSSEVARAFEEVKKHPNYKSQLLMTRTENGKLVKLDNGEITVEDLPT